jgi:hypothetical protein
MFIKLVKETAFHAKKIVILHARRATGIKHFPRCQILKPKPVKETSDKQSNLSQVFNVSSGFLSAAQKGDWMSKQEHCLYMCFRAGTVYMI